ncbi:MAG: DUF4982 domain-containing protein [Tannerellaceae bacterium]|jgi:beta-galactosidase|nr:DUF4982 domain-containing protein [Tannerellaceae bacterium]
MKLKWILILIGLIVSLHLSAQGYTGRQTIPFNEAWSFINKELPYAGQTDYQDAEWRIVDLPHDWSIEDRPSQTEDTITGPFSRYSTGRMATGWTVGGIGWYRKKFVSLKEWQDKNIHIYFDGVYMNADVWLNGYYLGNHPYGYTPFYYDLTPYLNPPGGENMLAVRVGNEGENSRWYSGSGIYRPVCLLVTERLHIDPWGVSVNTPEVSERRATIQVSTLVRNNFSSPKEVSVSTTVLDPEGKVAGRTTSALRIEPQTKEASLHKITVSEPLLWSTEEPVLYTALTEIKSGTDLIDKLETPFGIRSLVFDGEQGFLLNGKKVLLRGGCIHHDNGPLGASAFKRAEERKVEILKRNGYNAIRVSHNPASTDLLDACDRLGILVIEEAFDTWVRPKNPQDYHLYFNQWWQRDLQAMIRRDRNHPSVIMWSIGNEIYEAPDLLGHELSKKLSDEVHQSDPTRPVTAGIVFLPPYTKQPWEKYEPYLENLDVDGYNYFLETQSPFFVRDSATLNRFESEHAGHPHKTYYGSETLAIGALENWNKAERTPYILGCFKWTAFDYIGEAGIGLSRFRQQNRPELKGMGGMGVFAREEWPVFNAYCGDFDLIGNKKSASYYQDIVWRMSPVELLVRPPVAEGLKESVAPWGFPEGLKSWTWPGQEGNTLRVYVYTRSEKVRLERNGITIAEQKLPEGSITATFEVEYQPGELVAKAFDKDKETGYSRLTTTGKPAAVRLVGEQHPVRADIGDLAYINVEIVDQDGNRVPYVNDLTVDFQLTGEATIAAVGNGSPTDMTGFQQPRKNVYRGRALVIIRPTGRKGKAVLKATAGHLKEDVVTIDLN